MMTNPGLPHQQGARAGFRIAGVVLVAIGIFFLVAAMIDFFQTMNSDSMEGPHRFWMAFVGLPLLAVGGWCLQAGFFGAASRYLAGEAAPVVKDSLEYLTDGHGRAHLGGATRDRYCTQCASAQDADARFCSSCGSALT